MGHPTCCRGLSAIAQFRRSGRSGKLVRVRDRGSARVPGQVSRGGVDGDDLRKLLLTEYRAEIKSKSKTETVRRQDAEVEERKPDIPHLRNGNFRDFCRGKLQRLKRLRESYFCLVGRVCSVNLILPAFGAFWIKNPSAFWPFLIKAVS